MFEDEDNDIHYDPERIEVMLTKLQDLVIGLQNYLEVELMKFDVAELRYLTEFYDKTLVYDVNRDIRKLLYGNPTEVRH
jgi:hypothetical protein